MLAGNVQALIVSDTDRLTRNVVHLALIAEACTRAGARLLVVKERLPSVEDIVLGRAGATGMLRVERERLRDRMLQGKRARALAGKIHGAGAEKYGYRRDKQRGLRVIDEQEAAGVRAIFAWVTLDRLSCGAVLRRLNQDGVPPPATGKFKRTDTARRPRWGNGQLHRMLTDPAYKGETVAWRWHRRGAQRMLEEWPGDEWIHLPDEVTPALVSAELWTATQAHVVQRQEVSRQQQDTRRRYLLTGHIWCAVCGRRMWSDPHAGEPIYRCASRRAVSGKCGSSQVHGPAAEAWVSHQLGALLDDAGLTAAARAHVRVVLHDPVAAVDRDMLHDFATQLDARWERLAAVKADMVLGELVVRELEHVEHLQQCVQAERQDFEEWFARMQQPVTELAAVQALQRNRQAGAVCTWDELRLALHALRLRVVANGRQWRLVTGAVGEDVVIAETYGRLLRS